MGVEKKRGRDRHDGFGEKKREKFLETLRETCHVVRSAARAGVSATTAYKHYHRDPEFGARWSEALALGYVRLEEKLLAHALREVSDPDDAEGAAAADAASRAAGEPADWAHGGGRLRAPETNRGCTAGKSPFNDTRLALALLNRHRGSVEQGRVATVAGRWTATPEDTDAALRKQLEALARKLDAKK